jgi:hypothetical protein
MLDPRGSQFLSTQLLRIRSACVFGRSETSWQLRHGGEDESDAEYRGASIGPVPGTR